MLFFFLLWWLFCITLPTLLLIILLCTFCFVLFNSYCKNYLSCSAACKRRCSSEISYCNEDWMLAKSVRSTYNSFSCPCNVHFSALAFVSCSCSCLHFAFYTSNFALIELTKELSPLLILLILLLKLLFLTCSFNLFTCNCICALFWFSLSIIVCNV